jgi:hypothetical protein
MKPPKCRLCSHEHWNNEPHVFASNTAINTKDAINKIAVNAAPKVVESQRKEVVPVRAAVGVPALSAVPEAVSPNRRKRSDYNEYMREYMRKRRASQ